MEGPLPAGATPHPDGRVCARDNLDWSGSIDYDYYVAVELGIDVDSRFFG